MHLIEIFESRAKPAAGIYITLTRKCPLRCEHCSTDSSPETNEAPDRQNLINFVKSFNETTSPRYLCLTGGEPLQLPELVTKLCNEAHRSNTKVVLYTGFFFASYPRIPYIIEKAIRQLDHLSISIDYYHEKQIGRKKIFDTLDRVLKLGPDISVSTTGINGDDPYLKNLLEDLKQKFGNTISVYVSYIEPVGRASQLVNITSNDHSDYKDGYFYGCKRCSWPVISFNGDIVACCNPDVVNKKYPNHLFLGNICDMKWKDIREKVLTSNILKAIRTIGPKTISKDVLKMKPASYCDTCFDLSSHGDINAELQRVFNKYFLEMMDNMVTQSRGSNDALDVRRAKFRELLSFGSD